MKDGIDNLRSDIGKRDEHVSCRHALAVAMTEEACREVRGMPRG